MTKKSETDLRTMIRNKVIFLLGVEGIVNEVVEACEKYGTDIYVWASAVTNSEARANCYNVDLIPPFHIYDDNGNDLRGPFWYMEDVYDEAGVIFDESPHYEYLEIQNFASNSCHRIELGDEYEGGEELTQEQINELFGMKEDVRFHFNDGMTRPPEPELFQFNPEDIITDILNDAGEDKDDESD